MNNTKTIFAVSQLPTLQNRVYKTSKEANNCVKGDVALALDPLTGIITNIAFDKNLVTYNENYDNEQCHSKAYLHHLEKVHQLIRKYLGREKLFEIGCGKGRLIEILNRSGCDITGCDRSYIGMDPGISCNLYPFENAPTNRKIILRHVLEHVPNPIGFLRTIAQVNCGGLIYIEVPCFEWILKKRAWFDIFYEHVNYFCLKDFLRIFSDLVAFEHFFGEQYFYVIADLDNLRDDTAINKSVSSVSSIQIPHDFEPNFENNAKHDDVIWGAASKGVRYCMARQQQGYPVKAAVDINPMKQNCFLPGSGVPIVSPHDFLANYRPPRKIIVMNSNYLEEISSLAGSDYRYEVLDA